MRLVAALAAGTACCVAVAAASGDAHPGPAAFQRKFDVAWALDEAKAKAQEAEKRAVEVSKQVESATGSAVGTLEKQAAVVSKHLGNASGVFTDVVATKGKRAALKAVLTYLGTCDDYFANLASIPRELAPFLAESLQEQQRGPGEKDSEFCRKAAKEGLESAIEAKLANRSIEERTALTWLAADYVDKVCTRKLVGGLGVFESIRKSFPLPYMEAVQDKLFLEVLTQDAVAAELQDLCGRRAGIQQYSESFAEESPAAAPLRGRRAVATLLGASCLLLLAVPLVVRRQARLERPEPCADAVEDGLLLPTDSEL